MLRFLLVLFVLLFVVAGQAEAKKKKGSKGKRAYGMGGCGLGSLIISPTGSQTSAATTNGSSYSQSFGITSGTSNCVATDDMVALHEQQKFITGNLGSLAKEMAQGQGTVLVAYSETLGCTKTVFPVFASHLQSHFGDIFAAPGAVAVLNATKARLKQHNVLNQQCTHIHI